MQRDWVRKNEKSDDAEKKEMVSLARSIAPGTVNSSMMTVDTRHVVMADGMVFGAPSLSENSETEDVETKLCGVCKVPICYHVGKPGVGKCLVGAFTKTFESLFQAVKTLTSQLQSERAEAKDREQRLNSRLDTMEGQLTKQRKMIADLEVRLLEEMKMKESQMWQKLLKIQSQKPAPCHHPQTAPGA